MIAINIPVLNISRSSPVVAFGDVRYPPGGRLGPRIQQRYQLVVMREGEAYIEIDGTEIHVPEHHGVLLLPQRREVFRWTRDRPTHHSWCEVAPSFMPDSMRDDIGTRTLVLPVTDRILDTVAFGLRIPLSPPVSADDLIGAAGLMVMQAWLFEAALVERPVAQPEALRRALAFMEAHLAEPLTLDAIAGAVTTSPQHLTRLFRQHLDATPMRYLWQLRTRRGAELLGTTGLTVGEIAAQVGFQTPFHFSRMVSQYYQVSPRRLRQRLWEGIGDGG